MSKYPNDLHPGPLLVLENSSTPRHVQVRFGDPGQDTIRHSARSLRQWQHRPHSLIFPCRKCQLRETSALLIIPISDISIHQIRQTLLVLYP